MSLNTISLRFVSKISLKSDHYLVGAEFCQGFMRTVLRGDPNTLCDSGKEIVSAEQCRSASTALGLKIDDLNEDAKNYPGGCYYYDDETYFNNNSGKKESESRPICFKGKASSYY